MLKKGIGILLAALLLLGLLPAVVAMGADIEHVTNGGFSEIAADTGKAVGWSHYPKSGTIGFPTEGTYAGMAELKNNAYLTQSLKKVMAGATYTFRGLLYVVSGGEKPASSKGEIKVAYIDANGKETSEPAYSFITDDPNTVYKKEVLFIFTVPERTESVTIYVRSGTYGTAYWDDISVIGAIKPITNETDPFVEKPAGSIELLTDGGFEALKEDGKKLEHWGGVGSSTSTYSISVVEGKAADGTVHGGTHAIHMTATSDNPLIAQKIYNLEVGATYQASFWYKIDSMYAEPGFKIEWYQTDALGDDHYINGVWVRKAPIMSKMDEWAQYCYRFTVPENCTYLTYAVRLYTGDGEYAVTIDDASLYIIEEAPILPAKLSTDEIFYYTDMTEGTATVRLNTEDFPNIAKTELVLKSETEALWSTEVQREAGDSFVRRFPLTDMKEWGDYTLAVTAKDAAENTLGDVQTLSIHRYPRPENMRADGTILVDNAPFYPVFVYHMEKKDLGYAKALGINVSQTRGGETLAVLKDYLDAAEAAEVKCLVSLYAGMKPAGHPDNVANTTEVISGRKDADGNVIVEGLKDHPAVLAWMVMDEATSHWPDRWDLFYESYKLIRTLDPVHPVYILQNNSAQFEELAKYTDILAYDPYPSTRSVLTQHVAKNTNIATEGVDFEKPVWSLNKAYAASDTPSGNSRPMPTIMQERHMWYQALMEGASVVGYYSYSDCLVEPETPMHKLDTEKYDLYPGLLEFAKGEMQESYDHFLRHKYPVFREGREENAWYTSYVKDEKVYAIILNRFEEKRTVTIPLESDGGSVKVGAFTAERIYGGEETLSGSGSLTVTLEPCGAYVYAITPTESTDFSGLKRTQFHDLAEAAWAGEAIREMENAQILSGTSPSSFRPCEKVTRGTLAAWLETAFGVTVAAENGERELTRQEMLTLFGEALSAYGAQPVIMPEITAALQTEIAAGNIAENETVTRAEAAYALQTAYALRDMAGTGVGVYRDGSALWTYSAGTCTIRCSEEADVSALRAAVYQRTKDGTLEMIRLLDTEKTEDGWNVTLPEGNFVLKVFLWGDGLSPRYKNIEL